MNCEDCPNNTPVLCPYQNDGNGHCPENDKLENDNEEDSNGIIP